ncbi:MAG: FHA domain-containing protein [Bacteroidota bacterium]
MELHVGRTPENEIVLDHPRVSRKHARLTRLSDNVMLLEDLDSTWGTFVNGLQVRRTTITRGDIIKFANVQYGMDKHFDAGTRFSTPVPAKPKVGDDYSAEFLILKEVYEAYQSTRAKAMKGEKRKQLLVRAGFAIIPYVGNAIGILASSALSSGEKLAALDAEFKLNYVCPRCKHFLGNVPYEGLVAQKSCRRCRARWVQP